MAAVVVLDGYINFIETKEDKNGNPYYTFQISHKVKDEWVNYSCMSFTNDIENRNIADKDFVQVTGELSPTTKNDKTYLNVRVHGFTKVGKSKNTEEEEDAVVATPPVNKPANPFKR